MTLFMTSRSFLDTNILVYADDHSSAVKQTKAQNLIAEGRRSGNAVLSTQILQEYFVATTRKLGVPADIASAKIAIYSRFPLAIIDSEDILAAIDLHRLHQFSLWDALVIRAALQMKCRILYTEDLQHERRIDGLTIVNPFVD